MSDDPFAQPKTLKEARREIPTRDDVQMRLLACQQASDYEAALVCVSLLDHLFMQAISTKFVTLNTDRYNAIFVDGGNAPLSTFSAKIKIMYALGLLGTNTRAQAERANNIRNHFAHHKDRVSFTDEVVKKECEKFVDAIKGVDGIKCITQLAAPKTKYVHTCLYISLITLAYLEVIKEGHMFTLPLDAF